MFSLSRHWPRPSVTVFVALQALDILTTLVGLRVGAVEASLFVNRMLHLGPMAGLVIAKIFALLLMMAAFAFQRGRLVVFLNFWFAGVVTWNLVVIFMTASGSLLPPSL